MLEDIGKNSDANFHMKLDKMEDVNYHKAFNCLRRHLHAIQYVLIKNIYSILDFLYILEEIFVLQIIAASSIFSCCLQLRSHSRFCRFAKLIESTFTNIFLVSISLNMICGSICGIQVCTNFFL